MYYFSESREKEKEREKERESRGAPSSYSPVNSARAGVQNHGRLFRELWRHCRHRTPIGTVRARAYRTTPSRRTPPAARNLRRRSRVYVRTCTRSGGVSKYVHTRKRGGGVVRDGRGNGDGVSGRCCWCWYWCVVVAAAAAAAMVAGGTAYLHEHPLLPLTLTPTRGSTTSAANPPAGGDGGGGGGGGGGRGEQDTVNRRTDQAGERYPRSTGHAL